MRRESDSLSAIVRNAGLPVSLRTHCLNVVTINQTAITNRRDDCMSVIERALRDILNAALAVKEFILKESTEQKKHAKGVQQPENAQATKSDDGSPNVIIVVSSPPPPDASNSACDKAKERREQKLLLVQSINVIVTTSVFGVMIFQSCEMKKATDTATTQVKTAQDQLAEMKTQRQF